MKDARRLLPFMIAAGLAGAGAGCTEPPCEPAVLAPLDVSPAFVVLTSDYVTSAIALLDVEGNLMTEAWVDSGTLASGLTTTMSGDVTLPTFPGTLGGLTWIDRVNGTFTTVGVPDGSILHQIAVTPRMVEGEVAFRANPHDLIGLPDGRVLVSRFDVNPSARAQPLDRGNDLVVADRVTEMLVDRIDMGALDDTTPGGAGAVARPDRIVPAGDRLVVGTARLSEAFDQAASGAIAIVDPLTQVVDTVRIDGLANCGEVAPVAGDGDRVVVVCSGAPFTVESLRRAQSGLAVVLVEAGIASVEYLYRAADHEGLPVPTHGLVSLGGTVVVVAALGDLEQDTVDRLLRVDVATGDVQELLVGGGALAFGTGAFDPTTGLLIVPEATAGVHRFMQALDSPELTPLDPVAVSPCRALPAREARRLVPGPR